MSIKVNMMAAQISSYESIDQLKALNGVSIEEIEKRARPDAQSECGFLGKNEKLKDVLKADWHTVEALGTTHTELADEITAIWKKATEKPSLDSIKYTSNLKSKFKKVDPKVTKSCTDSIFFKLNLVIALVSVVATLFFTWLGLIGFIPAALLIISDLSCSSLKAPDPAPEHQRLYVEHEASKEDQEDIFDPNMGNGWNDELTITNSQNGVRVTIGKGVIDYIRNYGFYAGGGEENPFRVDPARLYDILTGEELAKVRERVQAYKRNETTSGTAVATGKGANNVTPVTIERVLKYRGDLEADAKMNAQVQDANTLKITFRVPFLLTIRNQDILNSGAEVIVNAANTHLGGGNGIDGLIHQKGGDEYAQNHKQLKAYYKGQYTEGYAAMIGSGKLKQSHKIDNVIVVAGPQGDPTPEKESQLYSCYFNSLELAHNQGKKSIAFPSISTGIFKFPKDRAAAISLKAVHDFTHKFPESQLQTISIHFLNASGLKEYQSIVMK
jgi:O-acetyl-ADP-ribose deacetylase (regulator of RNase III)